MQYRIYNRRTLEYRDGGYVVSYNIDDDYIVNNNSTISIVKRETDKDKFLNSVVVGDIIVLIQDSGAFHKGVITAIDATALTISYKSDKELFNDNIINPLRDEDVFLDDDDTNNVADKWGVEKVIMLLSFFFSDDSAGADPLQALPIVFEADGDVIDEKTGEHGIYWTWADDSINIVDWLTELFEKYNLTLSWNIDFNTAEETLANRKPKYIVTLSAITNSGNVIKDNVDMQTITYTTKELPDATVCHVIDSEDKSLLATYYLTDTDGTYDITDDKTDTNRVLPVKTVIASFNTSSNTTGDTKELIKAAANEKIVPSQYNQAIEIRINSDSKMFDFANARFGDLYKIINERGTIDSVFTGKKISSKERWTTLYFGLGRQNYTDIIQIRLRKQRYTEVYNQ